MLLPTSGAANLSPLGPTTASPAAPLAPGPAVSPGLNHSSVSTVFDHGGNDSGNQLAQLAPAVECGRDDGGAAPPREYEPTGTGAFGAMSMLPFEDESPTEAVPAHVQEQIRCVHGKGHMC